jgi:probable selenium-dependent hydroxylase accessory protein YqeC
MVSGSKSKEYSFLEALGIERGDVVCFSGAGGKTSLMFRLAGEARKQSFKVLVTTSTKILVPDVDQYDALDLSGKLFSPDSVVAPGIYVGGKPTPVAGKMTGVAVDLLSCQRKHFDLVLIEADGAATKPLKGWNSTEPVIPDFTDKTIGVVDIQTIGNSICEALVHRLEIFSEITGCKAGESVSTHHLCRMILHEKGLFSQARGTEILYINKVESEADGKNVDALRAPLALTNQKIVAGSVQQGTIYG